MEINLTDHQIETLKGCLKYLKPIKDQVYKVLAQNPDFGCSNNGLHLDKSATNFFQSLELLTFDK